MEEGNGGEGEKCVVGLHEEVGQGGPAGLAIEFLEAVRSVEGIRGREYTLYASALVPGGKAKRPQACWTSLE